MKNEKMTNIEMREKEITAGQSGILLVKILFMAKNQLIIVFTNEKWV